VKKLTIYAGDEERADALREGSSDIAGTCKVEKIEFRACKGDGRPVSQGSDVCFVAEY